MAYFALTTTIPSKSGFVWFTVEVPEETLDDLHERISEDGSLICTRLTTTATGPHSRQIISREDVIVGLNAIITITPLHMELHEAES
ncbi:hypothetical protein I6H96_02685 [Brucella anthropi]|uniref:Uncharacterized protein n=1 Tax=Brucella anthropi (strain ATCC 49188 / DSM 6882 / CCUG 24695 / JCM 21032 / LMG 3331 / NBRC 15819 / NCTC 12168 / Alc 37) TaxID=439375 RepID=A6WZ53_BRUA4|nr:hypothetical protein [Brucella anthropi]ABS14257.1 hypothetical protein Oant_1541 [Brucella anthropi ATCC 49188]QQC25787.1 hypothetical protein I6H96_02685 [Brucella anthropi]RRY08853.1 hypothetical protein EGJ58_13220 [Brucella anthropi]SUA65429.1 Uncharacterised protein [Brucella anthropi]